MIPPDLEAVWAGPHGQIHFRVRGLQGIPFCNLAYTRRRIDWQVVPPREVRHMIPEDVCQRCRPSLESSQKSAPETP